MKLRCREVLDAHARSLTSARMHAHTDTHACFVFTPVFSFSQQQVKLLQIIAWGQPLLHSIQCCLILSVWSLWNPKFLLLKVWACFLSLSPSTFCWGEGVIILFGRAALLKVLKSITTTAATHWCWVKKMQVNHLKMFGHNVSKNTGNKVKCWGFVGVVWKDIPITRMGPNETHAHTHTH